MRANLLSPMVLAFGLGAIATLMRSDVKLPQGLYNALSVYLLFAIGLKGGSSLAEASFDQVLWPLLGTIGLGLVTPLIAFGVALGAGKMSRIDAAAMAAHYGSVSAVTFMAAVSMTQSAGMVSEGFMPALVAALEVPAILLGLLLAHSRSATPTGEVVREVLAGRTVLLLLGSMAVGFLSGPEGLKQVAPVFVDPFKGALVFFLLEMGTLAAERFRDLVGKRGLMLIAFGIAVPLVNGALGVYVGSLVGLSVGGTAVLGTMSSSASYIAAPAAVRLALPQANPSIYLTASLGVTFPFNLSIGIPLYLEMARLVCA